MITKLYPDGRNFIGEDKDNEHTLYGKIVKGLIDEGTFNLVFQVEVWVQLSTKVVLTM